MVDFDVYYGHRNDISGFANALKEFDNFLPKFISNLHPTDRLVITADHGNDPTTPSTDHSENMFRFCILERIRVLRIWE